MSDEADFRWQWLQALRCHRLNTSSTQSMTETTRFPWSSLRCSSNQTYCFPSLIHCLSFGRGYYSGEDSSLKRPKQKKNIDSKTDFFCFISNFYMNFKFGLVDINFSFISGSIDGIFSVFRFQQRNATSSKTESLTK
jgi:hypothetical protein